MYEKYFKELKTRSLDQKGPVQLVLTFPKIKHKVSKKTKEAPKSIQLSQDHRFGFIGLETQEKEMRSQGVTYVGEDQVLSSVSDKNSSLDKVLMNPSALSYMDPIKRESLSFWKKMPLQAEDGFVYHLDQIHKHRGKEFLLKKGENRSWAIPVGYLHWEAKELNEQFCQIIKQIQQEGNLHVKKQFLLNAFGGKVTLPSIL
tara:strand:- start:1830 stop:2432 length:603 start_codon:yes stop_codon:yes gene_type:complete